VPNSQPRELEFNLRFFKAKCETAANKKFYTKFFGNHATNVQN
jgi:hypothetical protein